MFSNWSQSLSHTAGALNCQQCWLGCGCFTEDKPYLLPSHLLRQGWYVLYKKMWLYLVVLDNYNVPFSVICFSKFKLAGGRSALWHPIFDSWHGNGFPSLPTLYPFLQVTRIGLTASRKIYLFSSLVHNKHYQSFKKVIVGFQLSLSCVDVSGIESMR